MLENIKESKDCGIYVYEYMNKGEKRLLLFTKVNINSCNVHKTKWCRSNNFEAPGIGWNFASATGYGMCLQKVGEQTSSMGSGSCLSFLFYFMRMKGKSVF